MSGEPLVSYNTTQTLPVNVCVEFPKEDNEVLCLRQDSISNTFELEEHKLSEIIKSSEKHTEENEHCTNSTSNSNKYDFNKKEPIRQNLKNNLYPQSSGNSMKNIWTTQNQISQNSNNFLESFLKSKNSGRGGTISKIEDLVKDKMVHELRKKLIRQSQNSNFESSFKNKSKGKLFSMRKKNKLSQASSKNPKRMECNVLSTPSQKNLIAQKSTKFHINKANLSKEDFSFPKHKLNTLFELRKQKSSKKSLLEKKIMLQTKYSRNRTASKGIKANRQHSIFEEAQAKFKQNESSIRAADLLQKIVSKDKSPLSRLGIKVNKEIMKSSRNNSNRFKVKRTKTRDFGERTNIQSESRYLRNKATLSKGESLDLSKCSNNNQNQTGKKKKGHFYFKKSLQKQFYNQEVRII